MKSYCEPKITVLLATNGKKTEHQYLDRLKDRIHQEVGSKYSVTVKFIDGDPGKAFRKITAPLADTSNYDHIWLVVDKDDNDISDFLKACSAENLRKKEESQNNFFKAIISNPCFEVWLIAHYDNLKNYQNQDDVKNHYGEIVGESPENKDLPDGFPFENYSSAIGKVASRNESNLYSNFEGDSPFTGMPEIFEIYGLSNVAEADAINVECGVRIAKGSEGYFLTSGRNEECGEIFISGLFSNEHITTINLKFHLFHNDFKSLSGFIEGWYPYSGGVDDRERGSGYFPEGNISTQVISNYSPQNKIYKYCSKSKSLSLDLTNSEATLETDFLMPPQIVSLQIFTNRNREILLIQKYEEGKKEPVENLIL